MTLILTLLALGGAIALLAGYAPLRQALGQSGWPGYPPHPPGAGLIRHAHDAELASIGVRDGWV